MVWYRISQRGEGSKNGERLITLGKMVMTSIFQMVSLSKDVAKEN
jgi:hypothetical protein